MGKMCSKIKVQFLQIFRGNLTHRFTCVVFKLPDYLDAPARLEPGKGFILTYNAIIWPPWPLRGAWMAVSSDVFFPLISLGSQSIQIREEAWVVLTPRPVQFPFTFRSLGDCHKRQTNRMAALPLYLRFSEPTWAVSGPLYQFRPPRHFFPSLFVIRV